MVLHALLLEFLRYSVPPDRFIDWTIARLPTAKIPKWFVSAFFAFFASLLFWSFQVFLRWLLGNRWKCQKDLPQESRNPWWPGLAKINHSSGLNLILFFANDSMKQWKMMNKIIKYVVFYDILCIWFILCIVSRSDSSFDLPRLSPLSPRLPLPHFGSPCWWLPSNFGDLVGQLSKRLSINVHSCPYFGSPICLSQSLGQASRKQSRNWRKPARQSQDGRFLMSKPMPQCHNATTHHDFIPTW